MGESTKAVCALLMIVGVFAAVIAWSADRPNMISWGFRIGGPAVSLLTLGLILALHFRTDRECDYLRRRCGTYFNRDGLCFAIDAISKDGIACMVAYFQSQYDQPCRGRIALRPARGFFLNRANIDAIVFDVECPAAGFGYALVPIPIPLEFQGKQQSFEVGASVRYLNGKGERIRFHDGVLLRADAHFEDPVGSGLAVAGAATGTIFLRRPATAKVTLPRNVSETLPVTRSQRVEILWQSGERALKVAG
jgi:hypothetical protein